MTPEQLVFATVAVQLTLLLVQTALSHTRQHRVSHGRRMRSREFLNADCRRPADEQSVGGVADNELALSTRRRMRRQDVPRVIAAR